MKRNGKTSAGTQRWRCTSCNASTTRRNNNRAKQLTGFLSWLLSSKRQAEMPGNGRSFRRRVEQYWKIWPIAAVCDEIHHVVQVDGLWLGRRVVVLIACTDEYVIGWHLARSENSSAWAALMARISPPDVVVTDGGSGFEKARRIVWPNTRVQRCTFHAFGQVKRCTTTRPNLEAGAELYSIAKDLLHAESLSDAATWMAGFANWCSRWETFLKEKIVVDGRSRFKHERLRKARRGLEKLVREGTLFTYLNEDLIKEGIVPATNNRIEGGVNAQLREMLRRHRGMSLTKQTKAIFWWCYMHTEYPLSNAGILEEMPTDESIAKLYREVGESSQENDTPAQWGKAVAWNEFHSSEPFRTDYD